MMPAGSEQPSSAPAEFLFPKLNDGGSSPNPGRSFYLIRDATAKIAGAAPSTVLIRAPSCSRCGLKAFSPHRRWRKEGAEKVEPGRRDAGASRRVMFHHGE